MFGFRLNSFTFPIFKMGYNAMYACRTFSASSTGHRKRFYKKVGIAHSGGEFEITLDGRKLKTPSGQIFRVNSEPLALAVANEWDAQHEKIVISSMHISSLCNTVIDNPNKLSKYDIVQHILTFHDNDTLLCRQEENPEWARLQNAEWNPIVDFFSRRYGVEIEPSSSILGPTISDETRRILERHLLSNNIWAVHGIMYGVDIVKSLIVGMSCMDGYLSVENAVRLAMLETEFQTQQWGRVEWAHDIDIYEMQSRFAASVLFVHLANSAAGLERKISH